MCTCVYCIYVMHRQSKHGVHNVVQHKAALHQRWPVAAHRGRARKTNNDGV